MNPETPQTPLDYLNQIAVKPQKTSLFAQRKMFLIIVGSVVAILLGIIIVNVASSVINPTEQLGARLVTTQKVVDAAIPQIKTSQLRTYNGNLKIYLTNTIRNLTPILKKSQINILAPSAKIKSLEADTKITAALETARLNAVYDRTYAREIAYKLDTILTLMRQIQKSTGDSALKTLLADAIKNLEPTQTQFADFNAANG